jgi:hypothetical protein
VKQGVSHGEATNFAKMKSIVTLSQKAEVGAREEQFARMIRMHDEELRDGLRWNEVIQLVGSHEIFMINYEKYDLEEDDLPDTCQTIDEATRNSKS